MDKHGITCRINGHSLDEDSSCALDQRVESA
jgi:hypothetical protein